MPEPRIETSVAGRPKVAAADPLDAYPFLRACVEDYCLAIKLSSDPGLARHAVCLMHDAIEFALYEILVHTNHDIYRDGQHTIGLDEALATCRRLNVNVPLIGTIRAIQKHRGDAKHHAQRPDGKVFDKILREFRIIVSNLVHEHFGESLGESLATLGLATYHQGLYDCYRKYRNHSWNLALRNALAALLHKHRELMKLPQEYASARNGEPFELLAAIEKDIAKAVYPAAKREVLQFIRDVPAKLSEFLAKADDRSAAEYAGRVYLHIDEIFPSSFDISAARKLTPKLMQLPPGAASGGGAWSKYEIGDTAQTREQLQKVCAFLKLHPEIVKSLGPPFDMEDDDRYWKWWEFAIFDGEQWSVFHLNDDFAISLESQLFSEEGPHRREQLAKAICEEFMSLHKDREGSRTD